MHIPANITEKGEQYLQKLEERLSSARQKGHLEEKGQAPEMEITIHKKGVSEEWLRARVLHQILEDGRIYIHEDLNKGWRSMSNIVLLQQLYWLKKRGYVEELTPLTEKEWKYVL